MSIIMHPLTAAGGIPSYTADDYRHVVNPMMVPSNGKAFDGLQGVRAGFQSPLVTLDGLTVTVAPHCGVICPWDGSGVYTYAITAAETVQVPDSKSNYKIAVVVDDLTQAQGVIPGGRVQSFPGSTPDSNIPGLIIALVSPGVITGVAPVLHPNMLVEVPDEGDLEALSAVDGQEALVSATGQRFVRRDGLWKNTFEAVSFDWNGGTISFLYGATLCTVQVSGVTLDKGSWASATCTKRVDEAYRPAVEVSAPLCVENGGSVTGLIAVSSDGYVSVKNMGAGGSEGRRRGSVSWPVSSRY